jgi:hypothetical protein
MLDLLDMVEDAVFICVLLTGALLFAMAQFLTGNSVAYTPTFEFYDFVDNWLAAWMLSLLLSSPWHRCWWWGGLHVMRCSGVLILRYGAKHCFGVHLIYDNFLVIVLNHFELWIICWFLSTFHYSVFGQTRVGLCIQDLFMIVGFRILLLLQAVDDWARDARASLDGMLHAACVDEVLRHFAQHRVTAAVAFML